MKKLLGLLVLLGAVSAIGQQTPNLKLNIPAPGTPGWGLLLNANFSALDSLIPTPPNADYCFISTGVLPAQWGWQACPGGISGATTGSGSGLQGGGVSGTLNLSLLTTCATSQILQWNGSAWICASPGTGTISGVTAGTGLTGGGSTGSVTLNIANLISANTTGNAATASALAAVPAQCPGSQFVTGIAANGNANCGTPSGSGTITGVSPTTGGGLTGGGISGAVSMGLITSCATNQVLQWSGSAWLCGNAGTGTITNVVAGTGLTGGGASGSVTVNLANPIASNTSGNAATASALASTPSQCSGSPQQFSTGIAASGNAQCSVPPQGTITGATTAAGSGLSGGGSSGSLALTLLTTCSTNNVLAWSGTAWACTAPTTGTITSVTAGTGLTGGGSSGGVTLNLAGTISSNTTGSAGSFTGSLVGDVTGTQGATVVGKINGVSLAGLTTGILKNTTTTGVPSIAVAGDFPVLNQNTTGTAAALTATPTLCSTGFAPTGILASGNATGCAALTAGGTVTHTAGALTSGVGIVGNGSADAKADANFDDGVTTANTFTVKSSAGLAVNSGGLASILSIGDSTTHCPVTLSVSNTSAICSATFLPTWIWNNAGTTTSTLFETQNNRAVGGGYASLDGSAFVPATQLNNFPAAVFGITGNTQLSVTSTAITTTLADYGVSPSTTANGVTDNATSATDTTTNFYTDTGSSSVHQSFAARIRGVNQLQIVEQAGPQGQVIIGSAITPANLGSSPFNKFWVLSSTAAHNVETIAQTSATATGTLLSLNNVTASGTAWNALSVCAGATGSNGQCGSGTVVAKIDGTGALTAANGTFNGDGVHAGYTGLFGNTTAPTVVANSAGWIGPNSASFTGYGLQLPTANPSGGQVLTCATPTSGVSACTWGTGGGSSVLSALTAATGTNTIANGDNAQLWNWALTTAGKTAFTFGETTAATSTGTPYILKTTTLIGSTATPLNVANSLNGSQTLPALSITPTWNTTGVVDAALFVNVTNTASGTGSLLADFQIGSTSEYKIDKAGNSTQLGTSTASAQIANGSGAGFWYGAQGSDNCVANQPANSVCWEAPATIATSYHGLYAATPSTGIPHYAYSSPTITQSISLIAIADLSASGTPSSTTFLRGDNTWSTPSGAGTVTSVTFTGDGTVLSATPSSAVTTTGTVTAALANAGAGTVLGNATGAAAAPTYTSTPVLGLAGTTAGTLGLTNTTSGKITIATPAGALGTVTNTLQAVADTFVYRTTTDTLTNKSISLQQITSASGAVATWANGNNPLVINCALTSGTTCLTTGEATAATTAGAVEHQITTATTSTSIPLQITQGANGPANAAAPNVINIAVAAAGGLSGASNAGSVGAGYSFLSGAGSAGGATTGNGGAGGAWTATLGAGGAGGGTTTNNGGAGGAFAYTTGAGGNAAATGTSGSGGNFTVTLGVGGTTGTTVGSSGQFKVTGTAPASVSVSAGIPVGTIFSVLGVTGGATSNAAGTAGVGSIASIVGGNGGAGTGTNAVGGAGGAVNLTAGNGGASAGTGINSNGGNIVLTPGTAGTGGSGTAGLAGTVSVSGTGAGFVYLTQGTGITTANTNIPANSIIDQAPTAVTAYTNTRPGVAAQGVMAGTLSGSTITQGISGDSNHAATVTIGSGTSIGLTSLCSTTFCPAGTYQISAYMDVSTACTTTGTYTLLLTFTDDGGAKSAVTFPVTGTGVTSNALGLASTTNFAQGDFILRSTGAAAIQYSTTAVACGTGGPMVGKLYLAVLPLQ